MLQLHRVDGFMSLRQNKFSAIAQVALRHKIIMLNFVLCNFIPNEGLPEE